MIRKYLTLGVREELDLGIQIRIWELVEDYRRDKLKLKEKLDYLQSFYLEKEGNQLKITHHEEDTGTEEDYVRSYSYELVAQRKNSYQGYVFVIENELSREEEPSYTMMLGREY